MTQPRFDLVIGNGTLIDGTGAAPRSADLGISDGRIAAIGDLAQADAAQRIDAHRNVVCPGFIDAHSHSDLTLLSDGRGLSKVHQGVTTEIVGNCGLGVAPVASRDAIAGIRDAIYIVDPDPSVPWTWQSMADYLRVVDDSGVSINVAPLAGHLSIHASVMGVCRPSPRRETNCAACRRCSTTLSATAPSASRPA